MKLKREECFLCVNSKENILLLLLDLYVCYFFWCGGCFNVVCIIVVLTKISTFFPAPQQIYVFTWIREELRQRHVSWDACERER